MMLKLRSNAVIYGVILSIFVLCVATFAEARSRGGGGRSISRSGPASRGSFSSRPSRTRQSPSQVKKTRQVKSAKANRGAQIGTVQENSQNKSRDTKRPDKGDREEAKEKWQDKKEERQEDRQEAIKDVQEDRQDFIKDELDDRWDDNDDFFAGVVVGGAVVGAAASSTSTSTTYIINLPCTTTAVVVDGVSYYNCSSTWYQRGYSGSQVVYIAVDAPPGY